MPPIEPSTGYPNSTAPPSVITLHRKNGGAGVLRHLLDRQPTWSSDGKEIAFVSNRDGVTSIYRMAADGTGIARLTSGHDGDWKPAWSPDGESLCFVSSRE